MKINTNIVVIAAIIIEYIALTLILYFSPFNSNFITRYISDRYLTFLIVVFLGVSYLIISLLLLSIILNQLSAFIFKKTVNKIFISKSNILRLKFLSMVLLFLIIITFNRNFGKEERLLWKYLHGINPVPEGIWTYKKTYIVSIAQNKILKEEIKGRDENSIYTINYEHHDSNCDSIEVNYLYGESCIYYFNRQNLDLLNLRKEGIDYLDSYSFKTKTDSIKNEFFDGKKITTELWVKNILERVSYYKTTSKNSFDQFNFPFRATQKFSLVLDSIVIK